MSWIDNSDSSPNTFLCFLTFTVESNQLHSEQSVAFLHSELARLENNYGIRWVSWIIMPNHFHGLFKTEKKHISTTLCRLKKGLARHLSLQIRIRKLFWQSVGDEPYDNNRASLPINTYARYIAEAPVRAGLVTQSEHWLTQYSVLMNPSEFTTKPSYGFELRSVS